MSVIFVVNLRFSQVYPTGVVSMFDHLLMGQLAKDKAFYNSDGTAM
jgi:hypothetical protein